MLRALFVAATVADAARIGEHEDVAAVRPHAPPALQEVSGFSNTKHSAEEKYTSIVESGNKLKEQVAASQKLDKVRDLLGLSVDTHGEDSVATLEKLKDIVRASGYEKKNMKKSVRKAFEKGWYHGDKGHGHFHGHSLLEQKVAHSLLEQDEKTDKSLENEIAELNDAEENHPKAKHPVEHNTLTQLSEKDEALDAGTYSALTGLKSKLNKENVAKDMAEELLKEGEKVAHQVSAEMSLGADHQLSAINQVLNSGVSSAQKLSDLMNILVSNEDMKAARAGRLAKEIEEDEIGTRGLIEDAVQDFVAFKTAEEHLAAVKGKGKVAAHFARKHKEKRGHLSKKQRKNLNSLLHQRIEAENAVSRLNFTLKRSAESAEKAQSSIKEKEKKAANAIHSMRGQATVQSNIEAAAQAEDKDALEVGRLVLQVEKVETKREIAQRELSQSSDAVDKLKSKMNGEKKHAGKKEKSKLAAKAKEAEKTASKAADTFWEVQDEVAMREQLRDITLEKIRVQNRAQALDDDKSKSRMDVLEDELSHGLTDSRGFRV